VVTENIPAPDERDRTVQVAGNSGWKHHPERGGRSPDARRLVVSALFFFPRGGSAQVRRSLTRALPAAGWQPTLAAGSLGPPGELTHAATFFAGVVERPWPVAASAYSSAIYNLAVAALVPALLIVLAFTEARGVTRLGLIISAPVMFLVILFVSLFFFCDGCD
jgi:hypothetical protein